MMTRNSSMSTATGYQLWLNALLFHVVWLFCVMGGEWVTAIGVALFLIVHQ